MSPSPQTPRLSLFTKVALCATAAFAFFSWGLEEVLHFEEQQNAQRDQALKADITGFWHLQKMTIDQINEAAAKYIAYYKLPPGSPLPPNTFHDPEDPTWKTLTSREALTLDNAYTSTQSGYVSTAYTMTVIQDVVPPLNHPYAYAVISWPRRLFGSTLEIYPKDNLGYAITQKAHIRQKQQASTQTPPPAPSTPTTP